MKLGAFSISLSVKDPGTSKQFYESLGFADVREIQRQLKAKNMQPPTEAD